jgi:hypothetical protein
MARRSVELVFVLLLAAACALSKEAPTTAILGAMGSEVHLLVEELEDAKDHEFEGIFFWEGRLRGRRVVVA